MAEKKKVVMSVRARRKMLEQKADSVPPKLGPGLTEPPVKEVPKEEPKAPVEEPEAVAPAVSRDAETKPERVIDAPKPVAPVAAPPPLPVSKPAAPAEDSAVSVGSSDIVMESDSSPGIPAAPEAPKAAKPAPLFSLDEGDDAAPAAAEPPAAVEEPEAPVSAPPAVLAVDDTSIAVADDAPAITKVSGTIAFSAQGDSKSLPSGYKLMYLGTEGHTSCKLFVVGKTSQEVVLDSKEAKTLQLDAGEGKQVSLTLTYKGANKEGHLEVDYEVEGEVGLVRGVMERVRGVRSSSRSWLKTFVSHLPEVVTGLGVAAIATTASLVGWIQDYMGSWHMPAVLGAAAVLEAVVVWTGVERAKERNKPSEGG